MAAINTRGPTLPAIRVQTGTGGCQTGRRALPAYANMIDAAVSIRMLNLFFPAPLWVDFSGVSTASTDHTRKTNPGTINAELDSVVNHSYLSSYYWTIPKMVSLLKNSDQNDDRRHSNRMPYPMDMRYRSGAAAGLGTIVDLSSNGMFFETLNPLKAGERLHIDFRFRNSRAAMEICGEITRTTPFGVGVRFLW